MASQWTIEYRQPAANYFSDNGLLVAELFRRIEALVYTDGLPPEGAHQNEPNIIWWDVEGHRVIYERRETENKIIIAIIKPL